MKKSFFLAVLTCVALSSIGPFAAANTPPGVDDVKFREVDSSEIPIDMASLRAGVVHYFLGLYRKGEPKRERELRRFEPILDVDKKFSSADGANYDLQVGRFAIWVNRPASSYTKERALGMKIQDQLTDIGTIKMLQGPGAYKITANREFAPVVENLLTYYNPTQDPSKFYYWQSMAAKLNADPADQLIPPAAAVELTRATKIHSVSARAVGFRIPMPITAAEELVSLVTYHPLADGSTVVIGTSLSAIVPHAVDDAVFAGIREDGLKFARYLTAALRAEH